MAVELLLLHALHGTRNGDQSVTMTVDSTDEKGLRRTSSNPFISTEEELQSTEPNMSSENKEILDAHGACFVPTTILSEQEKVVVRGYDWSKGNDVRAILDSYKTTGFQATNFGLAVDVINEMVMFKIYSLDICL